MKSLSASKSSKAPNSEVLLFFRAKNHPDSLLLKLG